MGIHLEAKSWRRERLAARGPQLALMVCCGVLSAVGLRAVLGTEPVPATQTVGTVPEARSDDEARALAEEFARTYLTWDASKPEQRVARLRRLAPELADDAEGASLALIGRQSVKWSAIAGDERSGGRRRVTVLVDTSRGAVSLSVPFTRGTDGRLQIADYPALVAVPSVTAEQEAPVLSPVSDDELVATATRALRSYLQRRGDALSADLLPGAVVALPDAVTRLVAVDEVEWAVANRELRVGLRAGWQDGGELRLTYALGVARQAGRWFVCWIGTEQTSGGRSR
jgi:hypothetical protein